MPGQFEAYKPAAGGNSVLVMFEKIIADTNAEENEARKSEADSAATYE